MDTALIRSHLLTAQTEIAEALRLLDDTAQVIRPGDNLMAILAAAPDGATFALEPACVFDLGSYELPKPVTLKSTIDPGPTRVSLALPGPILRGFGRTKPNTVLSGLRLEAPNNSATIWAMGSDNVADRCVLFAPQGCHRGFNVNAANLRISRCYVGNIYKDIDTQAVGGWDGTKNLLVEDCFLEASGENVMFGGAGAASEDNIPQDIVITDCHLFKPMAWKGSIAVKNLLEFKNCKRVTVRRCLMENSWVSGQTGYAIVLTVRNQAANDANPWSTIQDCLIEDCTTRGSAGGVSILGRDDSGPSITMENMVLRRNKFLDINTGIYGSNGRCLFLTGGPKNLSVEDCTWDGPGWINTALAFDQPQYKLEGFRYVGNRSLEGAYGIHGQSAPGLGKVVLDFYCPSGYTWERNVIEDYPDRNIAWPPGTTLVPKD